MDIQFNATSFLLNNKSDDHIVKFPYGSRNQNFTLEAEMNPQPSRVLLTLDGKEYQILEASKSDLDIKFWNQTIECEDSFDPIENKWKASIKLKEVGRHRSVDAKLVIENEVGNSTFDFSVKVVCPSEASSVCEKGICEESEMGITCNCDESGYYGDSCENSCLPPSIEITGLKGFRRDKNMKFLGIFSQQGSIESSKYNRKDIEASFEWEENTNKACLMYKSESGTKEIFVSDEKETKGCFIDNLKFSDKVSIVAFDSSKKYINYNSEFK